MRVAVYAPPELKPYYVEIEGPIMVYPFAGRLVKDVGRFTRAAKTIVTQHVWRDGSKKELLFTKPFESNYQTSPYGASAPFTAIA